jgi:hypothetical protein
MEPFLQPHIQTMHFAIVMIQKKRTSTFTYFLQQLPDEVLELENLTLANFFGNKLEQIPEGDWSKLRNLKKLDLQCNFLSSLDDSLRYLYVAGHGITMFAVL